MNKLQSFEEFSSFKAEQLKAENEAKIAKTRENAAGNFKKLLSEYGVSSVSELDEEQKTQFYTRLEEGNAFGEAVKNAKEEGKTEFEFQGKTYKVEESVSEASNPMGLSIAQTKKVAETLANAISKLDGVKCTVNTKTLEEDSFNLDVNGEMGDGGSYIIDSDGSVINVAVTPNEIYGNYKSSVEDFIKGLKKPVFESSEINESSEVKTEAISRLADFFRIPKSSLQKFKFDGSDNIKELSKVLNSASDQGTEMYYKMAIELAREEVGVDESVVNENYEVIYSDGISALKKFKSEAQALDFMKKEIASNKKLRDIAVYKPGMHSTTQTELVVAFWGDGSYLDNVSKKDAKLAAKKINEAEVNEAVSLKKGDIVKFKDGSFIYIVGPKGNGYDYKDGRELGHHPKGWFDMMISKGEAVVESVDEAFIGPFVFNDRMSDEKLKAMYNDALDGYANYSKGFQHSKSDYKQAYQEIEKILKKRGVSVDESVVSEAEIKSDEEFKEYAFTVLKKAFGEEFDEAKAQEVVDGILSKSEGDYGTAVGMLTSSLG